MKWNVIWQVDPDNVSTCIERDWFAELTSLVPVGSVTVDHDGKPLLRHVAPAAIICVSCPNQTNENDLIEYLSRLPKPRVLYHMSDEFLKVGSDLYQHCELVIRNGSANFDISDPKFIQIPLGYVNGMGNPSGISRNANARKYSFAFLGAMKHERESEMLGALRKLREPYFVRRTDTYEEATKYFNVSTINVYKDSVFVPNPKGNWSPECNRLYDALEWGCIPLIRRYGDSEYHTDYYDRLLGAHPIPTFDSWRDLADFAKNQLSDRVALDKLQSEISQWWQTYKSELQSTVAKRLHELMN